MKKTFRLSMTWLHTWCGLLLGWLLFAIFVTGTASYFKGEITRWTQPELQRADVAPAQLMDRAVHALQKISPDATSLYIVLPDARNPGLNLNWEDATGRGDKTVDAQTATLQARETRGGEFFYRFHFQLQLPYPWGRWIACFAAIFMLAALVTGVIAHRQFFKDFFTFRPGKNGRSWLDFHNLTGVIALPFCLMIGYTALVMLLEMYMPWGGLATTPPEKPAVVETAVADSFLVSASIADTVAAVKTARDSVAAPDTTVPLAKYSFLPHLPAMIAEVDRRWGPGQLRFSYAADLGTPAGRIGFGPGPSSSISIGGRDWVYFSAVTGELAPGEEESPRGLIRKFHDVLYGLHLAHFAGPLLRGLFFFLGLLGTAMTATGLVLWTVRRRAKHIRNGRFGFGHGLVERLNVIAIAGFPLSLATFFWANRILPVGMTGRGDWEVNTVFLVWGATALHATLRPVGRAWKEQLWAATALFGLLPLLDASVTGSYFRAAVATANTAHLGFDAVVLGIGILFAWTAIRLRDMSPSKNGTHQDADTAEISE